MIMRRLDGTAECLSGSTAAARVGLTCVCHFYIKLNAMYDRKLAVIKFDFVRSVLDVFDI